eukprot:scaffold847_cov385-Prasinococcus_capsulatus_cf.AAC.2
MQQDELQSKVRAFAPMLSTAGTASIDNELVANPAGRRRKTSAETDTTSQDCVIVRLVPWQIVVMPPS